MKRSGFKRAQVERRPPPPYKIVRKCPQAKIEDEARALAKSTPLRSEPYRRLVASLPCIRCGIAGHSQAAHPNTGKGAGMKTDDRLCFPLCAPRLGVPGCHALFDQHALYTREIRRRLEIEWGNQTRACIIGVGLWPPGLPHINPEATPCST